MFHYRGINTHQHLILYAVSESTSREGKKGKCRLLSVLAGCSMPGICSAQAWSKPSGQPVPWAPLSPAPGKGDLAAPCDLRGLADPKLTRGAPCPQFGGTAL